MDSNELLNQVVSVQEALDLMGNTIAGATMRKAIRKHQLPARKANTGHTRGVWLVVMSDVLALWPDGKRKNGRKSGEAWSGSATSPAEANR